MNILHKFGLEIMIFDKFIAPFIFWTFNRLMVVYLLRFLYKMTIKFEVQVLRSPKLAKMYLIECY